MNKQTTKPSKAFEYDVQTANEAVNSVNAQYALIESAKRLGGFASPLWRHGFMVGTIGQLAVKQGLTQQAVATVYGAAVMQKKQPLSKERAADKELVAKRKAAIKAGKFSERSKAEQGLENAARMALMRFCAAHSIKPANKARGKDVAGTGKVKTEAATPTANNATAADKFLRQQAAMLQAYAEKNRAMLSNAWLHAIGELAEAVTAILPQSE